MNWPDIIPITEGPMGYGISPIDNCEAGYVLYQCPGCGRTTRHALISIYMPNLNCTCNFPRCVYVMQQIGHWKHPNWIEFDERTYWEEKGLVTEGQFIPRYVKTEEELWMEMIGRNLRHHPLTTNAQSVNPTTEEKSPSWITKILNLWMGNGISLQR